MAEQNAKQEFYDEDEEDTISELSSSPSIPEGEIDFNFVYALHTFMATVEGQATSTKGDTLVLLDDTNSYWWLVRNIKDDSIGYLPAEHIETPPERLARLNKHRNVDNGATQMIDLNTVTTKSSSSRKFSLRKSRKQSSKAVTFSSPKFIEYDVFDSDSEDELEQILLPDQELDQRMDANSIPDSNAHEQGLTTEQRNGNVIVSAPVEIASPTPSNRSVNGRQAAPPGHAAQEAAEMNSLHKHKTSQSSVQSSDGGSSITNPDDGDAKEGKKKKGVFSNLFKKKSKRDKQTENTTTSPATSHATEFAQKSVISHDPVLEQDHTTQVDITPIHQRVNTSELPEAVKEMRSSVMMETDPVSVDMVDEPHARGPVDEVEMLHTQRAKSPHGPLQKEIQATVASEGESFVWTDRAVEAYLESEGDMYKRLLTVVRVQARSERARHGNRTDQPPHAFDGIERSINQMLKV